MLKKNNKKTKLKKSKKSDIKKDPEEYQNPNFTPCFQDEESTGPVDFCNDDEGPSGDKKTGSKKKSGGFQSMGLSAVTMKGIIRRGYLMPTPIQRKAIPPILEGRDVVAMARTGSGKTAAFLIPLFEKLQISKSTIGGSPTKFPRALILSPTRELATQTVRFFKDLGKFLPFKVATILGGESMESQFSALHEKPDVVVATPGRFMHLCVEMELKLDAVEYIVFDEADRLFEMGFGEQLSEILRRLSPNRQTLLFSATMPKLLVEFTKAGLQDPLLIRLDVDTKLSEHLSLTYFSCRTEEKIACLLCILKWIIDSHEQTMIFAATKHHVELLHWVLEEAGVSNCFIYSSLDSSARKIALGKFKTRKCNVMIVTDIAARGIDIPILDNVINFHFPCKPKLFMHRVGRVARAGKSGTAYSIVSPDETAFLLDLHLFLGKPVKFLMTTDTVTDNTPADSDSTVINVGRIPQDLLNEENGVLKVWLDTKSEFQSLTKVAKNGFNQYLKSRPNASSESNRRAKQIEVSNLKVHPLFAQHIEEDPMDTLINQMQGYRPNSTIFEIGPKASSDTHKVMKQKRIRDQQVIEKHRQFRQMSGVQNSNSTDDVVVSSSITGQSLPSKADTENYISYFPKDHHTESGLSVGTTFDKQVQESVLDITGDDSNVLKKQSSSMKWDRKRKRFVNVGSTPKNKKIKTESGAWISASYKSDRYQAWKEKSKVEKRNDMEADSGSDHEFDKSKTSGRNNSLQGLKPAFSKKLVKMGKNASKEDKKGKGKRISAGLKKPEQILKSRKLKEKMAAKNTPKSSRKKKGGGGGFSKGRTGGSFSGKGKKR